MKKRQNVPYICKESPRKKHLKASGRQESKTYSCVFRDKKGEKKIFRRNPTHEIFIILKNP